MRTEWIKNQQGYIGLASALGMMLIGLVAVSSSTMVNDSAVERANDTSSDRAYYYAQTGAEFALHKIDSGEDPRVTDFSVGFGSFSVAVSPNVVTVTGKSDIATESFSFATNFAGNCVNIECSNLTSMNQSLTNVTLNKSCLSTPTISEFKVAWNDDHGEKIIETQMNGTSVYQDIDGVGSGSWMDIQETQIPEDMATIPVNSINFNAPIVGGKTYTFTAKFSDTSEVTATCTDLTPPPPEDEGDSGGGGVGVPPQDLTPHYEVSNGQITVDAGSQVEFKVLCSEITYGLGGPEMDVRVNRARNGTYFNNWMYNNSDVDGGEIYTETAPAGTTPSTYKVKARAKYLTYYSQTYESTHTAQVKTLIDGDAPPPLDGFGGQKPVSQCIAPYLDRLTGKVNLLPCQVIMLFELGVNMTSNPDSLAADFQDLVMLITIDHCQ